MELLNKTFCLQSIHPFNQLDFHELVNIANVSKERFFKNNDIICKKNQILDGCYILLDKQVKPSLKNHSHIIGVPSVLFNTPVKETIQVDSIDGLSCFWLSRSHVFTIVEQCPNFLIGFFNMNML